MDALEHLNPEFAQHFDNAIRASGAMEKKFDDLLGTNRNLNVDSIFDEVSAQLGMEVRDVLGDELLEHIHQGKVATPRDHLCTHAAESFDLLG